MSATVCDCYYEPDDIQAFNLAGPHVARKAGFHCAVCSREVRLGQRCYDIRWIYCDGTGLFKRAHVACYELMQRFGDRICGGAWRLPFDLDAASQHAVAKGDESFWRDWLLLYERVWSGDYDTQTPEIDYGNAQSETRTSSSNQH